MSIFIVEEKYNFLCFIQSHLTYFLVLSKTINSDFIIDLMMNICLEKFKDITTPPRVKASTSILSTQNFFTLASLALYFQSKASCSIFALLIKLHALDSILSKLFKMLFLHMKLLCIHNCLNSRIIFITQSFDASSIKNFYNFKMVRMKSIFCCYILKLTPLNFSSFTPCT